MFCKRPPANMMMRAVLDVLPVISILKASLCLHERWHDHLEPAGLPSEGSLMTISSTFVHRADSPIGLSMHLCTATTSRAGDVAQTNVMEEAESGGSE